MKTIFTSLFRRFFPAPTTDSIISGITRSISDLRQIEEAEWALVEQKRKEFERVRVEIVEAIGRSDRAKRIADKFSDLVEA